MDRLKAPDTVGPVAGEPTRYEDDLYTWSGEQAAMLREGLVEDLDRANIADEVEDVGAREYDKLESALMLVLVHMLKWDHQSERRSRSWQNTIAEQRFRFERQIELNPGLKSRLSEALSVAYRYARQRASSETNIPIASFPAACAYEWTDILHRPFLYDPAES
jgi:hypothetical protein